MLLCPPLTVLDPSQQDFGCLSCSGVVGAAFCWGLSHKLLSLLGQPGICCPPISSTPVAVLPGTLFHCLVYGLCLNNEFDMAVMCRIN